jgi:hypothetical protein
MVMPNTGSKNEFRQLRLDGVSRSSAAHGSATRWTRLSLTIERGEFIALLGPRAAASRPRSTASPACCRCRTAASGWTSAHRHAAARAARLRHGVPELRAVPAHDGAANVGFGLKMRGVPRPRSTSAWPRRWTLVQLQATCRQAARPAVGRPAAARGHRARHRHRAAADADGRAAVQPGRQAAHGDAHRDPPHPPASWAAPPSTSRTTRTRRWRWPTASW